VPIRCPSGGCLFCGVGSVSRSAIEVSRRRGPLAVAKVVWRSVTTVPSALGSRGPDVVRGHVCPPCADAVDTEHAVGHSARAHALLAYLHSIAEEEKARRLRMLLVEDLLPPVLPGWGAQPPPRVANAEPWSHLRRVVSRL
jgi:hypothetical protein